ncbi:MAG: phasin family protein [Alphaproteobacteria bacterium]
MDKTTATPNFDPAAAFAPFALPTVDVDALITAQRRNVEALTAANQIAADGVKSFTTRQTEIVRGVFDDYAKAVNALMGVSDPQTGAVKQAELAKASFEKSVDSVRELAEIATKTQAETLDVLNKRVAEGLDEIQAFATKS